MITIPLWIIRYEHFIRHVWRMDAYFHQPASRWTVREAWFVAGVIAQTCREIRQERAEASPHA